MVAFSLIAAALLIAGSIGYFYYHSDTVGRRLVNNEQAKITATRRAVAAKPSTQVNCAALSDQNTASPQGLILARTIGMRAPVLGGDADAQLNVAVGHIPGSSWPGQPGTVVFAAHDVSYFSQITGLSVGQLVQFATPCATYDYQVTGHQIVRTGSPIYTSPLQDLLVLETCYPLDALYITPKRYLVTAKLTAVHQTGVITNLPQIETPSVPAPADLLAQGLTLATNNLPLGTLSVAGSPATSWSQSPAPVDAETAVLEEYFGALRSAEQDRPAWWTDLATAAAPFSRSLPLRGGQVSSYAATVDPELSVQGAEITGASLNLDLHVSGGSAPGEYLLNVVMAVQHGALRITEWKMTPSAA
ncbi:MAG TPA: class D sortase [Acidimicrobiales bacterium]|nr:class D sortase [Acidimicrobiales bacterium]